MILYDEEVVVTTRRVPRERVRLRTHTITEDREITERLRKEQIDVNAKGSR
jgi:stress response protein YsnF